MEIIVLVAAVTSPIWVLGFVFSFVVFMTKYEKRVLYQPDMGR